MSVETYLFIFCTIKSHACILVKLHACQIVMGETEGMGVSCILDYDGEAKLLQTPPLDTGVSLGGEGEDENMRKRYNANRYIRVLIIDLFAAIYSRDSKMKLSADSTVRCQLLYRNARKKVLLNCLSVGGRWCTTDALFQLGTTGVRQNGHVVKLREAEIFVQNI